MIGVFIFIGFLLIVLSFLIERYPFILAGYKPTTPKELVRFIRKSFLLTGVIYFPLSLVCAILNNGFVLTILLLAPMLIMLIVISRKSINYNQDKFI